MFFLRKEWLLCVLIGCLGWVSVALAEDVVVQQNQAASAVVPAPIATSALPEMAPPPLDMAAASMKKDGVCTRCHDESETKPILAIYQTKHGVKADPRTPNCQSCHGESEKHLHGDPNKKGRGAPDVLFGTKRGTSGSFAPSDATVQNAACLACHRKDANRSHWEGSTHQRENVACASCHVIHTTHDKVRDKRTQPEVCFACHKEQRAQINRPSHHPIPEGKMGCTDCHNPHGSIGPKLMKRDSVNETCYTCHMEKRGPFVQEHEPVGEDCTISHNPHGTTAESMLKMRPPFLCQSCHTPHLPVQPSLTGQIPPSPNSPGWWNGAAITQGRGCVNCHSEIHGSNNPNAANNPLFR
jgi:DmsE family decaheme c-type cytochrome